MKWIIKSKVEQSSRMLLLKVGNLYVVAARVFLFFFTGTGIQKLYLVVY